MNGESVATSMVDITKAYEGIHHQALWRAARRYGLDLAALRWRLQTYSMRRVVSMNSAVSRQLVVRALGVVAGCSGATTLLKA
eukprot:10240168-Prorocentrum_lima.AAC.1